MHIIKPSFSTSATIDFDKKKNVSNSAYSTYMYRDYEGIMEPVTYIMNRLKTKKNNFHPIHFDTHSQSIMSIIVKIVESKESKDVILQQLGELEKAMDLHEIL
jgi:hypothetical protein